MLNGVHLVGEDEDGDLYAGFDDHNPALDTEDLVADEGFQQALKTSYGTRPIASSAGRPPATGMRLGTAQFGKSRGFPPGSSMGGRPVTGVVSDANQARPMTAVRAAGYTSAGGGGAFDPLGQSRIAAPALEAKPEDSPEEKIRQLEKKVNELIEDSCFANEKKDFALALEKAKEAGRKERLLCRQREQYALSDQINLDITYSVLLNLAHQYHASSLHQEAINTYQVIVKNKMFSSAGRLRVNIGNVFYEQGKLSQAIKQYRIALDQIPATHHEMRIKIMRNIATAFIKLGQYSDALTSYQLIMNIKPDIEVAFNMLLCYYALGDNENIKKSYQIMVQINLNIDDDEKFSVSAGDDDQYALLLEATRTDKLRTYEKRKSQIAGKCIIAAAKLISPVIETSFDAGFDWCVECVKSSSYVELANELEITKAITYLKMKEFAKAVETLKTFEKRDTKMASQASINLSFIHLQEGDITEAERHADAAVNADRYNPAALVNRGNCLYAQEDYEKAKEYYSEAIGIEASCTEALYNLGLSYKRMDCIQEALDCFHKSQAIMPNHPEVIYQLANLYEIDGNMAEAIEWYHQLLSIVPTDPNILMKLAEIYDNDNDKSQAFQYQYEAFRYFPSNIDAIQWLGAYYIDAQFVEKALHYFERATLVQPGEVKWQLMAASCCRKIGNYQQALASYKQIHERFPDNAECLRFLVRLCTDQGLTQEMQEYSLKLKKAEKAKELREQRAQSGNRRYGSGGRTSSGNRRGSSSSERRGSQSSDRSSAKGIRSDPRSPPEDAYVNSNTSTREIDASYSDPIGESPARPRTSAGRKPLAHVEDEFEGEELGDDLLPE